MRFPFNISAMAEGSDFKLGMQLEFAKAHHKNITSRRKSERGLGLREIPDMSTQWLKLATSNLLHSLGLLKPIRKSHKGKAGVALG